MVNNVNPHLYALIAGEASGDTLGAGLMEAIKKRDPEAQFIGIGGIKMLKLGLKSQENMEDLSVMGLTEVLAHLPKILAIRKRIIKTLLEAMPCVVIGIDSPDFNLTVERKLKQRGIATIHYVSPSVWAWREGRLDNIKKSCDEVLALLPFEPDWYQQRGMSCTYVGHTLANQISIKIDKDECKKSIKLEENCVEPIKDKKIMGILPGSRAGVIKRMLPIYAQTCRELKKKLDVAFVCSVPNYNLAKSIKDLWLEVAPDLSLTIFVGHTRELIASTDAVLLTSGTIALETMLLKTPFVVAYKVSALSAFIARRMLKVDTYSLPNLIAKRKVVKELIQEHCTVENLTDEMYKLLSSDNLLMKKDFENIHLSMVCNSDEIACDAVFKILKQKNINPNLSGNQNNKQEPKF